MRSTLSLRAPPYAPAMLPWKYCTQFSGSLTSTMSPSMTAAAILSPGLMPTSRRMATGIVIWFLLLTVIGAHGGPRLLGIPCEYVAMVKHTKQPVKPTTG